MANAAVVVRSGVKNLALSQGQRQPLLTSEARLRADGKLGCCSSSVSFTGGELGGRFSVDSGKCLLSNHPVCPMQRIVPRRASNVIRAATKVKTPAEEAWSRKRDLLLQAKVRSVGPKDALKLQQKHGYKIVDVRPEGDYKEGHPAGALNAEMYRLIKDWTLWDISRRLAFAFFGMSRGTEQNPGFLDDIKSKLRKDDKIILACVAGGTMKPSPDFAFGKQSRSLIAAYLLVLAGFTNVVHMEGGLKEWFKQDLPLDVDASTLPLEVDTST